MKKIVVIITLFLAFVGCSSNESIVSYSSEKFEKLIQDNVDVQLVDVRKPDEYAAGHIENSININVLDSSFMEQTESLLDKSKPVAVYCRSGKRSMNAANQLVKKGYKVYNLKKGYKDWVIYQENKNK